jgi:uncharacterized protein YdhG (YjbR/CyaY superfamily)
MKKATSGDCGSAAEGNVISKNVDKYRGGVPEAARSALNTVCAAIQSVGPPEAISYRIPTFRYRGELLGFAVFPNHCNLFPLRLIMMKASKNGPQDFHTSEETIHFPVDKPLPAARVKELVKAQIAENEHKEQR